MLQNKLIEKLELFRAIGVLRDAVVTRIVRKRQELRRLVCVLRPVEPVRGVWVEGVHEADEVVRQVSGTPYAY